ncbi:D-isomer specific 2-hydroxyacid dehydrogenase [Apiosordaria backusii]|uniref:D-3-phosphoglycerate dehydrogenase n=1 Tax=Apiosordaria backusii TaxID=314023 RepID=A0AA40DJZ7_9PEZI|nr:D-isomer specific 2-hydroxyacid dehydrogenase [Apiosordaria backusii]
MAPSAIDPVSSSVTAPSPNTPRILIPEKLSPEGLALLSSSGFHLDIPPPTKVTASLLSAGAKLKVVARAGVGVDNIDVKAATEQGIIVVNSPSGNILAAAEHTIALLMATARNVPRGDQTLKQAKWERGKLVGVEVGGKTLGVVGLGKVGLKVARVASQGLGMQVVGLDPYASADVAKGAGVTLVGSLDELLPQVDFLTVHTPLLASTLNLLGEEQFKKMKSTARVLNVARGGVYNEEALLKALDEGWIAGAGIDVFTQEPPKEGSVPLKLAQHPKVVSTPHLGASTVEAQENVSIDVCKQVVEILKGGLPTAAVNAPLILPEEYRRLQPFVKLVEKIGSLYTQHYATTTTSLSNSHRFELTYHGDLASVSNTRPLFAALVKGLVSSISDAGGRDVNIVNATIIAKDRGIAIDEKHVSSSSPSSSSSTYASAVTLRSITTDGDNSQGREQIIEGYVSGNAVFISKLDKFAANFQPEGTLLILHNYDEPGKIGNVGMVLGRHGINITFMQVAGLNQEARRAVVDGPVDTENGLKEALMILGVGGEVTSELLEELGKAEGILDVSVVRL